MSNLYKLKTLLESIKENNITAYEIGKETKISVVTIQRIINGETKKPNFSTIEAIQQYLEKNIVGTNIKVNKVNEPEEVYVKNIDYKDEYLKCLEKSLSLMEENSNLKNLLVKKNIKF